MSDRARAYSYLLVTALVWGAAGPVIKFTLGSIDPLPFLSYRLLLSGVLAAFIIFNGGLKLPKSFKLKIMLVAYGLIATTFALGFLFIGLDNVTVLEQSLIAAAGPLIIVAGGVLFLKEKISKQEIIGITITLLGVFIVTIYPILTQTNGVSLSGNIFIILFLLFDAASVLLARELVKEKVPPAVVTNWAFLIGAITIIPFTLISNPLPTLVSSITSLAPIYHLGVWYMAFMSGTLAYWLFTKSEKYIEAGEAGLFYYLIPIFSAPLAVLWLNEEITPRFVIGAIIVSIGVAIAEIRRAKRTRKRRKKR